MRQNVHRKIYQLTFYGSTTQLLVLLLPEMSPSIINVCSDQISCRHIPEFQSIYGISPTHVKNSPTAFKFPDISMFSRQAATLLNKRLSFILYTQHIHTITIPPGFSHRYHKYVQAYHSLHFRAFYRQTGREYIAKIITKMPLLAMLKTYIGEPAQQ